MLASIIAWLSQSWFGSIVGFVVSWVQQRIASQNAANSAEQAAEGQHQTDGAQSVADQGSSDAQNAALDGLAQQLDNPVQAVVTPPPPTPPSSNGGKQ